MKVTKAIKNPTINALLKIVFFIFVLFEIDSKPNNILATNGHEVKN
jgi:hypothetical protein